MKLNFNAPHFPPYSVTEALKSGTTLPYLDHCKKNPAKPKVSRLIFFIIYLTSNVFLPGGSGTTIRHQHMNNTHHTK
jgi:hypothetical protein